MKHMKKFMALFAALALVLAMAVPAFAANAGSIEIDNANPSTTYNAYKMFDLTYKPAEGGNEASYSYTVASGWEDFFKTGAVGANYITIENGHVTGATFTTGSSESIAFAKAALAYVEEKSITAAGSATTGAQETTATIDNLPLGYYLVDTDAGALCSLGTTAYTAKIEEKNEVPSVTKQEKVDDEDWNQNTSQQIGKVVQYKTTIHAKKGAQNYVLHDVMTNGLTFNEDVTVKIGTVEVDTSKYTVQIGEGTGDSCTFHVTFTKDFCDSITESKEIEIYYSATVNANAVTRNGETNKTYLNYGENHKSNEDQTTTTIFSFDLVKYTQSNGVNYLLDGAEFALYEDAAKTIPVKFTYDATTKTYCVAANGDAKIEVKDGKVTITGLKKKTYYLEETKAPEGYNKLDNVQTIELNAENFVPTATINATAKTYENGGYGVLNNAGTTLPGTGGIGTTIFYVVGGGLMVAAVVLLVAKKRMENK